MDGNDTQSQYFSGDFLDQRPGHFVPARAEMFDHERKRISVRFSVQVFAAVSRFRANGRSGSGGCIADILSGVPF